MVRSTQRRYQGLFVTAEVAAALVLIIASGLLLRTLASLGQIDPGFDTRNISTAFVLKPKNDPTFVERLEHRLRTVPGVQSSALAFPIPFTGGGLTSGFNIKGSERRPGEPERHGEAYLVSPTYFDTLRIPVLAGRGFTSADRDKAPRVCIIDSRTAEKFFPDSSPLDREIAMYGGWARIVGVVRTIRATTVEAESRPVIYYPILQVPIFSQAAVLVRAAGPADSAIRDAVRDTNGAVAVFDNSSLEKRMQAALAVRSLMAVLISAFAAICLFLATVGISGVATQIIGERAPEIGVRMALGARPGQILTHFLRYGLLWGGAGVVAGLVASAFAQRWLQEFLFSVQPFDPAIFAAASAGVFLVVLTAIWWPARQASRIAPQSVLRHN